MDISLYRMIPPDVRDSVFVNTVPLMNVISHEIEDVVIDNGLKVDFYAGFQRFSFFTRQLARYQRLARVCRRVYVWGVPDIDPPAIPGVEYLVLSPEMGLAREWFLVVDTPEFFTALLTRETTYGQDVPKGHRAFEGIWTYDSDIVSRAQLLISQALGGTANPAPRRDYELQSRYLVQISNRLVQRQDEQNSQHVLSQHHSALLKAGLSHIETPLLVVDNQQHVITANAAMSITLGIPPGELTGRPLLECADGLFADLILVPSDTTQHTLPPLADGTTPSATGDPILDASGQAIGWLVTLGPSGSHTRAETATILPVASSLQRYLGGIQQLLAMLPSLTNRQEIQQRVVAQMQRLVTDANTLVQRLARLQEIETQGPPTPTPVAVGDTLQEILASVIDRAQAQGVTVKLTPDYPQNLVRGDAEQVRQAIHELVDNALRHSRCDTVTITTTAQESYVRIAIEDNGDGIDPADLTLLLQSAYRANAGQTGTLERMGLGIALAQAIARTHNGRLEAQSVVGRGSTFTLSFPAIR